MVTRRCFYMIPAKGEPVKIVHKIEENLLSHLPGRRLIYHTKESLHRNLREVLSGMCRIAMEYSPMQRIPSVSKVDGGLLDLIRSFGVEVVGSAPFLQEFTAVWSGTQYALHKEACAVLEEAVALAWDAIDKTLRKGGMITEYDLRTMMLRHFKEKECVTEGGPICAVNDHAADPHYLPPEEGSAPVRRGDLILFDLWCKKGVKESVFADITRMGVACDAPSPKQREVFSVVRKAQEAGMERLCKGVDPEERIPGYVIDRVVREVIEKSGYGPFFTHRTGHNIGTLLHGPGANLDDFETRDDRLLIPGTCFSIEPGIYLPGEFGVRLEYDVFIRRDGMPEATVPPQETFMTL